MRVKIDENTGCHLWLGMTTDNGYAAIVIFGKRIRVHRLIWIIYHGTIPATLRVLHTCDTPACIFIDHLFLGTQGENVADCVAKGRHAKGEVNGGRVLTEAEAREIIASDLPGVVLALRFRISTAQVSKIRNRKLWRHLK